VILQTECIPLEKLTRAEGKEKARRDVGLFPRLPERANSLGKGRAALFKAMATTRFCGLPALKLMVVRDDLF
jgi:hypothetical protein